jgi:hypothetical protein
VAAVTIAGGLGAAVAPTASAATPSCGSSCINLFASSYGSAFVLDVLNQSPNVGQEIILAPASNSNPGEDFTPAFQGLVSDFIAAGLVSPGLSGYDSNSVYEFEYAPYGVDSGLCVGVGATPAKHTPVSLQPCGVSAKTVWIWNSDKPITSSGNYASLINGATETSFSNPYSLTDLKPGGDRQLFTWTLQTCGVININQLWGATFGVLP